MADNELFGNSEQLDDTISRQAAIDALDKVAEMFPHRIPGNAKTYRQYNEAWSDAIDAAENALEALPTVDAVPVVRCKDCIRFRPDDDVWGWCTVSGKMRCKDFCSYGVREDGEQHD